MLTRVQGGEFKKENGKMEKGKKGKREHDVVGGWANGPTATTFVTSFSTLPMAHICRFGGDDTRHEPMAAVPSSTASGGEEHDALSYRVWGREGA